MKWLTIFDKSIVEPEPQRNIIDNRFVHQIDIEADPYLYGERYVRGYESYRIVLMCHKINYIDFGDKRFLEILG